jgi:hypothetical protein
MYIIDDLSAGMPSSLVPFYSERLMCFLYFSIPSLLFRSTFEIQVFYILKHGIVKYSTNQSNLVPSSSL